MSGPGASKSDLSSGEVAVGYAGTKFKPTLTCMWALGQSPIDDF